MAEKQKINCWSCNQETMAPGWCTNCNWRNVVALTETTTETGSFYCERHSKVHTGLPMEPYYMSGVIVHYIMKFPTEECRTWASK